MAEPLLLQIEGPIATITFNRPERRNAITFDMWNHLQRLLVDVQENPQVRVVVLRGAGQEAFAAGADIGEFETHRNNAAKATLYNAAFDAAMDMAEAVGKPTICLIMGACVGGGCELSTACDIRIAADNARFGVPIARLGLPVGFREMRRMVRLIGHAKTMELLLTADIIPASEALRIGLVQSRRAPGPGQKILPIPWRARLLLSPLWYTGCTRRLSRPCWITRPSQGSRRRSRHWPCRPLTPRIFRKDGGPFWKNARRSFAATEHRDKEKHCGIRYMCAALWQAGRYRAHRSGWRGAPKSWGLPRCG